MHFLKQEKQTYIRAISPGIIAYLRVLGFLSPGTQDNEAVILWKPTLFDKCSY